MASNNTSTRPHLGGRSSSSSSLSVSSSVYTLPGMEQPVPTLRSFVRATAPTPSFKQEKPLPPMPSRRRPSSSIYSTCSNQDFDSVEAQPRPLSSEFFLQPVPFRCSNPDLSEQSRAVERHLKSMIDQSPVTEDRRPRSSVRKSRPTLLEPKTYSPRIGAHSPSSNVQSVNSRGSPVQSKPTEPSYIVLQPLVDESTPGDPIDSLKSGNLAMSSCWSDRVEVFRGPHSPQLPVMEQPRSVASDHARSLSLEKARTALGLDTKTLQDDSSRKHHHVFTRHHYRPPTRKQEKLNPFVAADPRSPILKSESSNHEVQMPEIRSYGAEYHAQLAQQYRSAKDQPSQRHAANSESRDTGLVPAPLFWKWHKRSSSDKSTSTKSSKDTSPAKSSFMSGEGTLLHQQNASKDRFQGQTQMPERSAQIKHSTNSSSIKSPTQNPTRHKITAENASQHLAPSHPSPARKEARNLPQTPPSSRRLFGRAAAMPASAPSSPSGSSPVKSTTSFLSIGRSISSPQKAQGRGGGGGGGGEEGRVLRGGAADANSAANPSRWTAKRTRSQKRRDELKASIRVVGEIDANAIGVAVGSEQGMRRGQGAATRDFGAWRGGA